MIKSFAKGAFATAATLSTVAAGLIYYGQNYLIYPSAFIPAGDAETPDAYGLAWEDVTLKTSDGVLLKCFFLPQRRELPLPTKFTQIRATRMEYAADETDDEFMARRPTVIMFHGNAGTIGHRVPLGMMFQLAMRCNVLMVSYRGYGTSTGSPSEKGLQTDAQTALDFVTADARLSRTVILYGQSIGGAIAIDVASRNPDKIAAIILENTFTSLPALVPDVMPFLAPLGSVSMPSLSLFFSSSSSPTVPNSSNISGPNSSTPQSLLTLLCHQKHDSLSKVPLISCPVLMLAGLQDEIVPAEHMRVLAEAFRSRRTDGTDAKELKFVEFPEGMHNTTSANRGYWEAVEEFVGRMSSSEKGQ